VRLKREGRSEIGVGRIGKGPAKKRVKKEKRVNWETKVNAWGGGQAKRWGRESASDIRRFSIILLLGQIGILSTKIGH